MCGACVQDKFNLKKTTQSQGIRDAEVVRVDQKDLRWWPERRPLGMEGAGRYGTGPGGHGVH